jgi:ubiquinone/menaquinone biosynthesis C-methylase UbiE
MIRNWLYALLLSKVTIGGYRQFLERCSQGQKVLDVGVGNGLMLHREHKVVAAKKLKIFGVDLHREYLRQCRELIDKYGLTEQMTVMEADFFKHDFGGERFDRVFFSMSLPLMSDQAAALARARELLAPGGQIMVCMTFQGERSRFMDFVKPKIKWFSTVDFGRVTYDAAWNETLVKAGVKEVERVEVLRVTSQARAAACILEPLALASASISP